MKSEVKLLLIVTVLAGIFLWLQLYFPFLKLWNAIVIFTGLLALIVRLTTRLSNKIVLLFVPAGFMTAYIIKVIIDVIADSTSHNLLPFEIILLSILNLLAALTGLGFGIAIKLIAAKISRR